jgi:hypothetical protein
VIPHGDLEFSNRKGQDRHIPLVFCRTVGCFTKATSPFSTRHLHSEDHISEEGQQEWEGDTKKESLTPTFPHQ